MRSTGRRTRDVMAGSAWSIVVTVTVAVAIAGGVVGCQPPRRETARIATAIAIRTPGRRPLPSRAPDDHGSGRHGGRHLPPSPPIGSSVGAAAPAGLNLRSLLAAARCVPRRRPRRRSSVRQLHRHGQILAANSQTTRQTWIGALSASLLPFHGCGSGAASDRAPADVVRGGRLRVPGMTCGRLVPAHGSQASGRGSKPPWSSSRGRVARHSGSPRGPAVVDRGGT
jgi:hypothetical protein